jgi:hypothetical protein
MEDRVDRDCSTDSRSKDRKVIIVMSDFQNSLVVVLNSWERLQYQLFSMWCTLRRSETQVRKIESQCRRVPQGDVSSILSKNARPHMRPETWII